MRTIGTSLASVLNTVHPEKAAEIHHHGLDNTGAERRVQHKHGAYGPVGAGWWPSWIDGREEGGAPLGACRRDNIGIINLIYFIAPCAGLPHDRTHKILFCCQNWDYNIL